MQSAANNSIPFYVLDRPNPIGDSVSGWVGERKKNQFCV